MIADFRLPISDWEEKARASSARLAMLFAVGISLACTAGAGELTRLYTRPQMRSLAMQLRLRPRWVKKGPLLQGLFIEYAMARGGSRANLGFIQPAGIGQTKAKVVTSKWGGGLRIEEPAFEVSAAPICPGVVVKTAVSRVEFFGGLKVLPQFLAWSANGKVQVKPATGTVPIGRMDQPWLLAWWGEKTPVTIRQGDEYLKHFSRSADHPVLLLPQHPVKSVQVGKDRWTVSFATKAGTVVIMALYGLNNPTGRETAGWAKGLPPQVAAQARDWARRMRRVPTDVTETYQLVKDGVRITEKFQYQDIDDAWKTPKQSWAFLPPIFGLARATGGPIEVTGAARDLPWLGSFGPLTVVDGRDSISFTIKIPQLEGYISKEPVWLKGEKADPRFRVLRDQLREEIDKILAVNEHMAPFHNLGAGIGGNWHWGNPGETIITLTWALPFLEPAKAAALKDYIKREFEAYDPLRISFAPFGKGARREFHDWDPTGKWEKSGFARSPRTSKNLHNLYAVWQYVANVAGKEAGKALWPRVKKYLEEDLPKAAYVWDGGESSAPQEQFRFKRMVNTTARLNGYLAYTRFARLAGDKEAESLGTCLFARGLAVTYAMAHYNQYLIDRGLQEGLVNFPPAFFCANERFQANRLPSFRANGLYFGNGFRQMEMPYHFFVDLSPEVGQFLHDYCRDPVTVTVKWMMWKCPTCWLNKGLRPFPSAQGEHWIIEPWVPWTNFLALSLAMRLPPDELYYYVGDGRAKFGDLYYIQRLALALRAWARDKR